MQPLLVDFKPSYQLTLLLIGMGLSMSAILIAMPIVWHIKLCVLLWMVASVIYATAKYALLMLPSSVVALHVAQQKVGRQNKIHIKRRGDHDSHEVAVCGETVVTPYLTVIRLQQKNAPLLRRVFKINIVLMADTTDATSFRKLRTWLRWGIRSL